MLKTHNRNFLYCKFCFSSVLRSFFPSSITTRFPPAIPSCLYFHTDILSWPGLGNQMGSTTNHPTYSNLPSTLKDQSMMRAELTGLYAFDHSSAVLVLWSRGFPKNFAIWKSKTLTDPGSENYSKNKLEGKMKNYKRLLKIFLIHWCWLLCFPQELTLSTCL